MRGLKRKDGRADFKGLFSMLIIVCMVLSTITVIIPIVSPKAKGVVHMGGSCAGEDGTPNDEDGIPGPNGIVLWTAANNPHQIPSDYYIEGGMTLNISFINGPVLIEFADGVMIEVDGTLNAIGSPTSRISFTTGSGSPAPSNWSEISIVAGNALFDYCDITYAEIGIHVYSNQQVIINHTNIKDNQYGLHCEGDGVITPNPIVTNSSFSENFLDAIILQDSDAIIYNNTILGGNGYAPFGVMNGGTGISVTTMVASSNYIYISNNTITGGSGIDDPGPPNAAEGGNAIELSGNVALTVIANNTILGGYGGNDTDNTGDASDGGQGIFDLNHDGSVNIVDNLLIEGGDGGSNTMDGGSAGRGGMGVHFYPIPDVPNTIEINSNDIIAGGDGGDNMAGFDGDGGDGGTAIQLADDPVISGGDVKIGYNEVIQGGAGGMNQADWFVNGWVTGEGGSGITIQNYKPFSMIPTNIVIDNNPWIMGGEGGENIGVGVLPIMPEVSEGGAGVVVINCTNIMLMRSMITGGNGGNNNPTAPQNLAIPGGGGNGVIAYSTNPTLYFSQIYIENCDITGGVGGANYSQTLIPRDAAGEGGMGLLFYGSTGTCTLSHIIGGQGGANFGNDGVGGEGGNGLVSFMDSFLINVNNGTLMGGKGGFNTNPSGGGGGGGTAVFATGTTGLTISDNDLIIGGDGGNDNALGGGAFGAGDASFSSIYADFQMGWVSDVIIANNRDISVGRGGTGLGVDGEDGDACIYGMGLVTSSIPFNYITNNDISSGNLTGGTVGIVLMAVDFVLISDNDIHNNTNGIQYNDASFGGSVTISSNEIYNRIATSGTGIFIVGGSSTISDNNVTDFENGIRTQGAGFYTLDNDRIRDCNTFGIIAENSNPMIYNSNISNIGNVGIYFTGSTTSKIYSTTILNSGTFNCYVDGGSSPQFYNCTITTTGPWDFYMDDGSNPWLLNTTFGKKAKTGFNDFMSGLTVNWYMHVRVQDMGGSPVVGAQVWANDTFGDPHPPSGNPSITDANGQANWIVVPEYIDRLGGDTDFNDYDVIAYSGPNYGNANPTMDISKDVFIVIDGYRWDIPLEKGWNMVSLPQNRTNTALTDVLNSIDGNYEAVRAYNSSDMLDPWEQYVVDKVSGPFESNNDLQDITNVKGLWIFMQTADVLEALGKIPVPSQTIISLNEGWNFVGYPSIITRPVGFGAGDAFQGLSGIIKIVWYYNASSPSTWKWEGWDDPGVYSPDTITYIRPGEGYWIYANQNSLWQVNWD